MFLIFEKAISLVAIQRAEMLLLRSPCYVVTFVKSVDEKKIKYFREHLKRVLEKQSSALATLLFVDWLPQVNGPPKSPVSLKS